MTKDLRNNVRHVAFTLLRPAGGIVDMDAWIGCDHTGRDCSENLIRIRVG